MVCVWQEIPHFPCGGLQRAGLVGSTISHLFLRTGRGQGTSWEVGLACELCPAPSAQERLEGVEGCKSFMNRQNSLGRKESGIGPA